MLPVSLSLSARDISDYFKVHTCCIVNAGPAFELRFKSLQSKYRADWLRNDPPVHLVQELCSDPGYQRRAIGRLLGQFRTFVPPCCALE